MKAILRALQKELVAGRDAVLVGVTASSGAVPRGAGARMVVGREGLLAGTIGGGMVEHRSLGMAQRQISEGHSREHEFRLDRNEVEDLGMICGGDVSLHFLLLEADREPLVEALESALEALERQLPAILLTGLCGDKPLFAVVLGEKLRGETADADPETLLAALRRLDGRQGLLQAGPCVFYAEALQYLDRIVVFGGGHVGRAVAQLASFLSYPVVVLDDREDFLDPARYPADCQVRRVDFDRIADAIQIGPDDCVCVMSRGHRFDEQIEEQMLATRARYIGVIGSQRKTRTIHANLKAKGWSDRELDRVTAPIGLAIGADTPEEIAVSILAQLIALRSEGRA